MDLEKFREDQIFPWKAYYLAGMYLPNKYHSRNFYCIYMIVASTDSYLIKYIVLIVLRLRHQKDLVMEIIEMSRKKRSLL